MHDAKHYLKNEIKNIIRDVKIKNSRKIFDEIKRIDEGIQLLLIDLNTLQFKITFKMEEISNELLVFDERTSEENELILLAFQQISNSKSDTTNVADLGESN